MKHSIFGVHQYNEIVGAVVIACVVLFLATFINVGLLKDWFYAPITLRVLLPDEGVSGLAPGAEVHVLGTRAGEVRRIVIDPDQHMHAVARIDAQMKPFIRRDSQVSIRRQFGVAGAAFIEISRGSGAELDWSYAVLTASSDRGPTDSITQMLEELRSKVFPLIDEARKAAEAFTLLAERAGDPSGPLEQTLASAASISRRIEKGEGLAGRLISSEKAAADVENTLASLRELAGQLERTSKDPRVGEILQRTNAILVSLQATTRGLAESTPKITRNVADSTDVLPATLLQAQLTAHELELLLAQLRQHWLFGGSGGTRPAAGSRAPAVQVRP